MREAKKIITIRCCVIAALLSGHPLRAQDRFIEWNENRKLVWKDFRARPPSDNPAAALSSTAIHIDWTYEGEHLRYHIQCRFDKDKSWGRIRNDSILVHEQGHFDLAEIFARLLNQTLRPYTSSTENKTPDVNAIYRDMMRRYLARQEAYDKATNYSRDRARQNAWLKKIKDELASLKQYAQYR